MRAQASLLIPGLAAVDELRRSLDPAMAARIPAHVTAIYDDEAPERDLLIARLRQVCAGLRPIFVQLDRVVSFPPPADGLYISVRVGTEFAILRSLVLQPPFAPRGPVFWPHVTLLHPRSVAARDAGWRAHVGKAIDLTATVAAVSVVQWDGEVWHVHERVRLGSG